MKTRIHGKGQKHDVPIVPKSLFFRSCFLLALFFAIGCGSEEKKTTSNMAKKTEESKQPQSQAESPGVGKEPSFSVDPCVLITRSDAEAIAGGMMNEPLQDNLQEPAGKGCRYFTIRESNLSRAVEIHVWESDNLKKSFYGWPADEYFSRFKAGHKNAGGDFEQLQGLGEDAYWWGAQVFILKGTHVLTVSARGLGSGGADTEAKNKEATIRAANIALGRLQ